MAEKVRQYVAIDAKSFYASVECVERHLNPLDDQSGRCRREPDGKDHLPGRIAFPESPRHSRPGAPV